MAEEAQPSGYRSVIRIPDSAPATLQEFADLAEIKAAELFSSVTHLDKVVLVPDAELPERVAAAYQGQDGGAMYWRTSSAQKLQRFLSGAYRSELSGTQRLAFLSDLRLELNVFLHELVHSLGVSSTAEFESNMRMGGSDPRVLAFSEGLTSVISDTYLESFIRSMGLDQIDPAILQVAKPWQMESYPGLTEATFVVLMSAAAHVASTADRQALTSVLNRAAKTGERFEVAAHNLNIDLPSIAAFDRQLVAAARGGNGVPTLMDVSKLCSWGVPAKAIATRCWR